ncbi:MAG: glyoxalase superfamily protein [Terriglobales bacterium]
MKASVLWRMLACSAAILLGTSGAVTTSNAQSQNHREVNVMLKRAVPNMVVADVERSHKFYRDMLEFETVQTVPPDKGPFVFVDLKRGGVEVFLNARPQEGPLAKAQPGGGMSLYVEVQGVDELAKKVEGRGIKLAVPLHTEFYGMREFAINDPDGYMLIFAERVK